MGYTGFNVEAGGADSLREGSGQAATAKQVSGRVCGYQDKVPTPALGEETRLMEGRLRVISSFSGISSRKQLEKG